MHWQDKFVRVCGIANIYTYVIYAYVLQTVAGFFMKVEMLGLLVGWRNATFACVVRIAIQFNQHSQQVFVFVINVHVFADVCKVLQRRSRQPFCI